MTIGGAATVTAPIPEVKRASAAAKRKAESQRPETLDDAIARLSVLKWTYAERSMFDDVTGALRSGEISRDESRKLSKKEIVELADELREMRRQARLAELVRTKPDNYRIITTPDEFDRFIDDLYREPIVAVDTETTGLDLFCDRIIGYSVWMPQADYGVYVPFAHTTGEAQLPEDVAMACIKPYLEDAARKTIWHNAKFDMHMLANHDINVANPYWDTQVGAHVLNENESHRLKDLAPKYLGVQADHFNSLFGDDPTIFDKPIGPSGIYAIKDVVFTWRLYEFQRKHIDARDGLRFIFYEVEMPQIKLCVDMERNGFLPDLGAAQLLASEFETEVKNAEKEVLAHYEIDEAFLATMSEKLSRQISEFSLSSPQHLQYLIYDYLRLPDITKSVNPKLSPKSTATKVIDALCEQEPSLEPIKQWREKAKLLTTYIQPLPDLIAPDGRIHSNFSQFGTETGRYSSSQYGAKNAKRGMNLQNIPARSKASKRVRGLFSAPPGYVIIGSDLSQIEPRVLSDMSGDSLLQKPYIEGWDLYMALASEVFNKPYEECGDGTWERKASKTALLAVMYGTSKWTLGQQLGISPDAAQQIIDDFFAKYTDVKRFIDETHVQLERYGFVETRFGRKRRFSDYREWHAKMRSLERIPWNRMTDEQRDQLREARKYVNGMKRAAVNARIQGTAADIMKMIMARMYDLCRKRGWQMLATIHDEVLIQVPESDVTQEAIAAIERVMTETVALNVAIRCDTVIQRTWGDEIPWRDWFGLNISEAKEAV